MIFQQETPYPMSMYQNSAFAIGSLFLRSSFASNPFLGLGGKWDLQRTYMGGTWEVQNNSCFT